MTLSVCPVVLRCRAHRTVPVACAFVVGRLSDFLFRDAPYGRRSRKEVFQPHLPVRLPCYDLAPVTGLTLGRSLR